MSEQVNYNQFTKKSFKMSCKALFANGNGVDVTPYLKRVRITHNFVTYVMPEYRLLFKLPPHIAADIQKDSDQVRFILDIDYFLQAATGTVENLEDAKRHYAPYLKKMTLKPLLSEDGLMNIDSIYDEKGKLKDGITAEVAFEVIGVPQISLDLNKPVITGVFRNVTVTEAVLALATRLNIKIHMVKPDNEQRYDQIILYPGNVFMNINHIHNTYGIYSDDLLVYSEGDVLYIAPLNGKDKKNGDVSMTVLFGKTSSEKYFGGTYNQVDPVTLTSTKSLLVQNTMVAVNDQGNLVNEFFGNNKTITGYDTHKYVQTTVTNDYRDSRGEVTKSKIYEDNQNNQFTQASFQNKATASHMVTVSHQHMEIMPTDCFKPIYMHFDNSNYNSFSGSYSCTGMSIEFRVKTNRLFKSHGSLTLRPVKK